MKRPPKPFARETRKLKPSTRPPENKIRGWRDDHADWKVQQPKPLAWHEVIQRQVEIFVARLRRPNDETILQEAAEAMTVVGEYRREAASVTPARDDLGEFYKVRPKNRNGAMARLLAMLGGSVVPFLLPKPGDYSAPRGVKEAIRRLKE